MFSQTLGVLGKSIKALSPDTGHIKDDSPPRMAINLEDRAMSDGEWFEKNIGHDKLMDEMRRDEEKAMKRREKEKARESSSDKKKGGWFGR